jgi:hypothetical protein
MIEPADKYEDQLESLHAVDGEDFYYYNLPYGVAARMGIARASERLA